MAESEADEYEAYWENYRTDPTPEQLAALRKEMDEYWGTPVPDDLSVIEVNAGGVPGEWVRTDTRGRRAGNAPSVDRSLIWKLVTKFDQGWIFIKVQICCKE